MFGYETKTITVSGHDIIIRELPTAWRVRISKWGTGEIPEDSLETIFQECVLNNDGSPMFTKTEVAKMSGKVIQTVFVKVLELSGVSQSGAQKKD